MPEDNMTNGWIVCAKKVVYGSALFFLLFLCVTSFIYSSDGYQLETNSIWRAVRDMAGCLLLCGMFWILARFVERRSWGIAMAGAAVLFLTVMLFSTWWIIHSANLPQSDAKSVYDIAVRAKNHDLLAIAPTGSYMSLWPFQSGLVLFFEIILRWIPGSDEMTIQWMYLPFIALSLVSGYMVVKRVFFSVRTRIFWCLLMLFCFPYYLHINNMYGEIPSISLSLLVLWMLLEYYRKPSRLKLLFAGIGGGRSGNKEKYTYFYHCMYTGMGSGMACEAAETLSDHYTCADHLNSGRYHFPAKIL